VGLAVDGVLTAVFAVVREVDVELYHLVGVGERSSSEGVSPGSYGPCRRVPCSEAYSRCYWSTYCFNEGPDF